MLLSTTLCWNPAHVATKRFCNSSVLWIGILDTSAVAVSELNCTNLIFIESGAIRAVLPRRVADTEAATSDPRHCWRRVCLPARQCASTSCSWHSWASAPRDNSSVLMCGQRTVLTSTPVITTYGAWCKCTEYQSAIRTSQGSVLLRHRLNFSRAWWTYMQLINGEKDWKHVSVQKVVTLNTCCDVAFPTFQLPHITTGSFQSHQCQPTTGCFQSHYTLYTSVWQADRQTRLLYQHRALQAALCLRAIKILQIDITSRV